MSNTPNPSNISFANRTGASLVERYYDLIVKNSAKFEKPPTTGDFEPSMRLPELDSRMVEFLSAATASMVDLGEYKGVPVRLLDLRRNPETQTTKTFASVLIVARAIRHIQETGKSIMLFSPSSGNKAIALRDAVTRALKAGLVEPHQLRIATLTPSQTVGKLRKSLLSEDPALRALNPIFVLDGSVPEAVKAVGQEFKKQFKDIGDNSIELWHSLRLENYRFADQMRAFYDFEVGFAGRTDVRTVHVHSVSSAYGLLGYYSGLQVLKESGQIVADPAFLLVQHMATSDMVKHLLQNSFDDKVVPSYTPRADGIWTQSASPHFPQRTWAPHEVLEHTFYTQKPATADEMTGLIATHGGSGVVVSLLECIERYAECAKLLERSDVKLPADPRQLREWSLVMALTGTMNAIDRNLISGVDGYTIHASGSYSVEDYEPVPESWVHRVNDAQDMIRSVFRTEPESLAASTAG